MSFLRVFAFVLAAAGLAACGGGGLPPAANYGTLKGVVTDAGSGQPVAGAVVTINSVLKSAPTGSDGSYSLYPIPIGPYDGSVSANGYQSKQFNGSIDPGATQTLNFTLAK